MVIRYKDKLCYDFDKKTPRAFSARQVWTCDLGLFPFRIISFSLFGITRPRPFGLRVWRTVRSSLELVVFSNVRFLIEGNTTSMNRIWWQSISVFWLDLLKLDLKHGSVLSFFRFHRLANLWFSHHVLHSQLLKEIWLLKTKSYQCATSVNSRDC